MDYSLSEDQAVLISAVRKILRDHADLPQSARLRYNYWDEGLRRKLVESGFFNIGWEIGPLDASLVTLEIAKIPAVVEVAASTIVMPQLFPGSQSVGPIALVSGKSIAKAHRFLTHAHSVVIDGGEEVLYLPIAPEEVEPVDTIYGYPYGRFRRVPDRSRMKSLGQRSVADLRKWWRVAIAVELAAAALSAVAFTADYVKQRFVFGKAIGSFQAVQHRLAQCHQIAQGMQYLALRAAWSGSEQDADLAACYAQQNVQKLIFDLHQFNGAMGVTTEHLLHFWTYRLRSLQSEAGGAYGAALDIASRLWGSEGNDQVESKLGVQT